MRGDGRTFSRVSLEPDIKCFSPKLACAIWVKSPIPPETDDTDDSDGGGDDSLALFRIERTQRRKPLLADINSNHFLACVY